MVVNPPINGWHAGELYVQDKLGFKAASRGQWAGIAPEMSTQHRMFYSSKLEFLPIATEDPETGHIWSTVLLPAAGDSKLKVRSPSPKDLIITALLVEGDPAVESLRNGGELIAGVGIEMSTRRRNKLAGRVAEFQASPESRSMTIHIEIDEALGNCPKYINVRSFIPAPKARALASPSTTVLGPSDHLPPTLVDFVHRCDTIFIGSVFHPTSGSEHSHLGSNHRGGLPGFCRVSSEPGRRSAVHIPDYSGNRLMTSLGNIAADPRAGVAFLDFATGDVLYVTGRAELLFAEEAEKVMPRIRCLTRLEIEEAVMINGVMPFRSDPKLPVEPSPYSPPVRFLTSEMSAGALRNLGSSAHGIKTLLVGAELLSPTLARFDFEAKEGLSWTSGQYAVLDWTDVVGKVPYQHMTWDGDERRVNDDGIRTWTISSPGPTDGKKTTAFSITMRRVPNGRITSILFELLRVASARGDSLRSLGVALSLRSLGGDFTISSPLAEGRRKWLCVAGGIGVTPALAFLAELVKRREPMQAEVWLACRAAELPVFRRLVQGALTGIGPTFTFRLRLFISSSSDPLPTLQDADDQLQTVTYSGRLDSASTGKADIAAALQDAVQEAEVYLCGPQAFEEAALEALKGLGADPAAVRRESFNF